MESAILREDWMRAEEGLTTEVFLDSDDISSAVAAEVAALVRRRQGEGGEAPSAGCSSACSDCRAARKRLHKAEVALPRHMHASSSFPELLVALPL
jgi:hypothetical protein